MRAIPLVISSALVPLIGAAGLVIGIAGCPTADPCAELVAYSGGGTDEVLTTLEDAKGRATTNADGPAITAPTDGQHLPKADAPTFTWTSPLKIARAESPSLTHRRFSPSFFDVLSSAAIPSARAHEPPVSSDVYLVQIPIDGEQCPVTLVTTDLSVKLDDATWARLQKTVGKTLTMSITSAYLEAGRITEGPYKGTPVTFQVE